MVALCNKNKLTPNANNNNKASHTHTENTWDGEMAMAFHHKCALGNRDNHTDQQVVVA